MDDLLVLENLFEKHNDQIHFDLFKKSNIIAINNDKGNFDREIILNTRSIASNSINYKNAYLLLNIQLSIPHDAVD